MQETDQVDHHGKAVALDKHRALLIPWGFPALVPLLHSR